MIKCAYRGDRTGVHVNGDVVCARLLITQSIDQAARESASKWKDRRVHIDWGAVLS